MDLQGNQPWGELVSELKIQMIECNPFLFSLMFFASKSARMVGLAFVVPAAAFSQSDIELFYSSQDKEEGHPHQNEGLFPYEGKSGPLQHNILYNHYKPAGRHNG